MTNKLFIQEYIQEVKHPTHLEDGHDIHYSSIEKGKILNVNEIKELQPYLYNKDYYEISFHSPFLGLATYHLVLKKDMNKFIERGEE